MFALLPFFQRLDVHDFVFAGTRCAYISVERVFGRNTTGAAAGYRDKEASAYRYQRHQPENTLLYRIVERYYPEFTAYLAEQGAILPMYLQREFEAYLKCGRP